MPPTAEPASPFIVQGRLLTDPGAPPELGWVSVENGRITEVHAGELPPSEAPPRFGGRDRVLCPAFTDAHIHLPQIDAVGCDGMTLLDWLDRVVFPAEAWWGRGGALADTRTALRRMAAAGTAGFAGYLTSHAEGAALAARLTARTPMRAIVGRVAMDRAAPDSLIDEDRARAKLRPIPSPVLPASLESGRLCLSANPRFAISCTPELLAEVGWAVKERRTLFVQTHLAEMQQECDEVRRLFPHAPHYTAVYDEAGLLTDRTLLAHAVHLSPDEWRLIAQRRSIVVHCPTANLFLQSGFFDLDAAESHRVRVALGSDVAGGPDVAMPRVARAMIEAAKARALTRPPGAPPVRIPSPGEVWDLITRRNALELGWADAGRIAVGAAADLLVLRTPDRWLDEHLVGRLIYNWDNALIEQRLFAGEPVSPDTILPA